MHILTDPSLSGKTKSAQVWWYHTFILSRLHFVQLIVNAHFSKDEGFSFLEKKRSSAEVCIFGARKDRVYVWIFEKESFKKFLTRLQLWRSNEVKLSLDLIRVVLVTTALHDTGQMQICYWCVCVCVCLDSFPSCGFCTFDFLVGELEIHHNRSKQRNLEEESEEQPLE